MSPLNPFQKENIIRRIAFIESELKDLQIHKKVTYTEYFNDRNKRRLIERIVENILNALADIAKIALSGEVGELPTSYKDSFLKLSTAGVIKDSLAKKLGIYMDLRNELAHQYLDLRWKPFQKFILESSKNIEQFIKVVKKFL